MITNSFGPFTIVLLLVLTIGVPILGVLDHRRLLKRTRQGQTDIRLRSFVWTIVMQWGLTLGFLAWWLHAGGELGPLRLLAAAAGLQWLAIGIGLLLTVFFVLQMVSVLRSPEKLDQLRQQSRSLSGIAPRTPAERRTFAAMAVTAGICEEILFRGLLIAALAELWGTWPAVALSSMVFGLGHAYQGLAGVGKTAIAGLVMALLTIGSGSLFVPILLHAVADLTGGRLLEAALGPVIPAQCT